MALSQVAEGDTLGGLAKKYHTTAKAISQANNLESEELSPEAKLIIPVTPAGRAAEARGSFAKQATRYQVRKGDTVLSVADDFGVPPESLRKWNHIKGNNLRKGRVITIHKPVASDDRVVASSGTHKKKKTAAAESVTFREGCDTQDAHGKAGRNPLQYRQPVQHTTVAALQRDNSPPPRSCVWAMCWSSAVNPN